IDTSVLYYGTGDRLLNRHGSQRRSRGSMIRELRAIHWAALLGLAILVPACASSSGGQSSGSSGSTITLGASLSLTGALGSFGVDQRVGYQQAVADANAAGGIKLGGTAYRVKLVVLNNQSDPTTAAQ